MQLDWDDNEEKDLAGYNVYRRTPPRSAFQRLNIDPLANSSYTDSSFGHQDGASLYYVTALDADYNESAHLDVVVAGYLIFLPLVP